MARVGFPLLALLFILPEGEKSLSAQAGERIAETVIPGEARSMAGRLAATDRLVSRGEWYAALDEYQRLLHEPVNTLVPLDPQNPRHLVSLRRLVHARLAALPEKALRLYRLRVDGKARRWLAEARAHRDPTPLHRLIDDAFCSTQTDEALELLGDLKFERGNFDEARRCWRPIAGPPGLSTPQTVLAPLRIPQPKVDVARVRAKLLLAQLFQGELADAAAGIESFRRQYPDAQGYLAGRTSVYADVMQEILHRAREAGPPGGDADWTTFAGNYARNYIAFDVPDRRFWGARPGWKVRLDRPEDRTDSETAPVVSSSIATRQLAFFPIIMGDLILVSDACTVKAYDRRTGRPVFLYDLTRDLVGESFKTLWRKLPAPADLRYSLSATDDAVFARLGRQKLGPRGGADLDTYLVCLDLGPGTGKRGARRWLVHATEKQGENGAFEGPPVVHDGLVYIAHSRFKGIHTQTAVVCYRAEDGTELWRQQICVTAEFKGDPAPRYRHHLLTLAGPNLVYCSHSGAVVAVELRTGRPAWAVRYPSLMGLVASDSATARDLGACLYHNDRVFVVPADSNTLYCLDAETGRTLWGREGLDPVHLLGVARGRLVLTARDGLRAIDAATGNDSGGWAQPDTGRLPGFGRPLAAGEWIFWPTQDSDFPVRAIHLNDGTQEHDGRVFNPIELRRIPPGNLAFAHGCLVSAGSEEMTVYVAPPSAPSGGRSPK
jgi:outer membrane protein assembly factor BamB